MDDSEQEWPYAKERERRIAEFHGNYMNNTKWCELLRLVEIGRLVPPRWETQDVEAIKALTSTLGQFETDDGEGFRVFGYR